MAPALGTLPNLTYVPLHQPIVCTLHNKMVMVSKAFPELCESFQ